MKIKLKLKKDWKDETDQEIKAGQIVELEEGQATKDMVYDGIAEKWSAEDQKAADKKEQEATEGAIQKLVDAAVAKVAVSAAGKIPANVKSEEDKNFGFKGYGDFALQVKASSGGQLTSKMGAYVESTKQPTEFLNEGTNSEGGFAIPENYATAIWERAKMAVDLLGRTDNTNLTTGFSMVFPGDAETSRATGSRAGGLRGHHTAEGAQKTQSRPTIDRQRLELHKITVLSGITDELAADGPAMGQYLVRKQADELQFMIGDQLVRGTGAGMARGIMNCACKEQVTRAVAGTITTPDIESMWALMYAPSLANAVWHINQDVWPQLFGLEKAVGVGGSAAYMPAGGLSAAPYGTLLGKPILPLEWINTQASADSIMFVDWNQYRTITKGGVQAASSIHLWFDYNTTAFRAEFRLDGSGIWKAALTPYQGTDDQSPIIGLTA